MKPFELAYLPRSEATFTVEGRAVFVMVDDAILDAWSARVIDPGFDPAAAVALARSMGDPGPLLEGETVETLSPAMVVVDFTERWNSFWARIFEGTELKKAVEGLVAYLERLPAGDEGGGEK